jgi:lipopolysaccharide transport system ATP-binding protein
MSGFALRVENLSKVYRLGTYDPYLALRLSARHTLRRLKRAILRRPPPPPLKPSNGDLLWALNDVSFEVRHGEAIGIIGRNGAGKSTLLKILSRITRPSRGYADVYGRLGALLEVGTGFHPELTGRDNIYLNATILGMRQSEIKDRFDEIVAFAEVERFIDTPVKYYSSGMYVRLAFAVSAHLDPNILLLDEVLAVGDIAFQKKCLGKMGRVVKDEGRTILFVSHSMESIRKFCSRVILLEDGKVSMDGPTDVVIGKYLGQDSCGLSPSIALPDGGFENRPTTLNGNMGDQRPLGVGSWLRFYSQKGEHKALFLLDESWRIVLEFELFKYVPHCIAAIGVATFDQIPIATYWSRPQDLPPGRYAVEYSVDLPLKACELQFTVGLSTYERSFYYKENLGRVSIVEVTEGEQPIRAKGAGLLRTPQTAEIRAVCDNNFRPGGEAA